MTEDDPGEVDVVPAWAAEPDVVAPEPEPGKGFLAFPDLRPAWDGSPRLVAPAEWASLHGGLSYREWLAQQESAFDHRADRQAYARYTPLDDFDDDWSY